MLLLAATLTIALAAVPAAATANEGQRCVALYRDADHCGATNAMGEIICVRRMNNLAHLMNCVVSKEPGREALCSLNQNDRTYHHWGPANSRLDCVEPLGVIMNGHLDAGCSTCSLYSLFQSCPDGEDFFLCLCHNKTHLDNWGCLARCFNMGLPEQWYDHMCANSYAKRAALELAANSTSSDAGSSSADARHQDQGHQGHQDADHGIPRDSHKMATFDPSAPVDVGAFRRDVHVKEKRGGVQGGNVGDPNNKNIYQWIVSHILFFFFSSSSCPCPSTPILLFYKTSQLANVRVSAQDDAGYTFWIDDYGRPNYDNDVIGFPLPWFQELLFDNTVTQRCYFMPWSINQFCIRWLHPVVTYVDKAIYQGRFNKATYGTKQFSTNLDLDAAPSRTAAPLVLSSTSVSFTQEFDSVDVSATAPVSLPSVQVTSAPPPAASVTTFQGKKNAAATAAPAAGLAAVVGVQAVVAVYQIM